jgi:hypothetical protein
MSWSNCRAGAFIAMKKSSTKRKTTDAMERLGLASEGDGLRLFRNAVEYFK